MNRGVTQSCSASFFLRCVVGALLLPGVLSVFFVGCQRPAVHAMVDEAFTLVYPQLSSKLIKEFPAASPREKNLGPYIPYPLQPEKIESLIDAQEKGSSSAFSKEGQEAAEPVSIFVMTPALAGVFPLSKPSRQVVGICMLAPTESFYSVEWDSAWAYRELGLIAGYRLASLQREDKGARAAILFSRGTGRSSEELEAFTQSFEQGVSLEGPTPSGGRLADDALVVFDLESMQLPGDQLEQILSAMRQVEDKKPRLVVLATGSRTALEKAANMKNIEIIADTRGLGSDVPIKNLFAAIGENDEALVSATRRLAQTIGAGKAAPKRVFVRPSLVLSKKAKTIRALLPKQR